MTPIPAVPIPPRVAHDVGELGDVVERTLSAQGKNSRSRHARNAAYRRATSAINHLGPDLFPLIHSAEEKVIGTRDLRNAAAGIANIRAKRYELHGVVDVVTNMTLAGVPTQNRLGEAVRNAVPNATGNFEVIVDYKGSRRPPSNPASAYWQQGDWQIQTYAWLRMRQPHALPVVAGILLYINELDPSDDHIASLKRELANNATDVVPIPGSQDAYQLNAWRPGRQINLSLEYRLARAIRVVAVTAASQQQAGQQFDNTVVQIEQCVSAEANAGHIQRNWVAQGDEESCAACDFRHFCPNPHPHDPNFQVEAPAAP
jgi:hypothetical protein